LAREPRKPTIIPIITAITIQQTPKTLRTTIRIEMPVRTTTTITTTMIILISLIIIIIIIIILRIKTTLLQII